MNRYLKALIGLYLVCAAAAFAFGMFGAATGKDLWAVMLAFGASVYFSAWAIHAMHKERQAGAR